MRPAGLILNTEHYHERQEEEQGREGDSEKGEDEGAEPSKRAQGPKEERQARPLD